ncbi:MAG TPA: hypothetical protein DEF04_11285 [Clostridiales bacterium]|nr:hypothetical protein [Clostridiales bacterium]
MYSIMAVKVEERVAKAPDLQEILTEHGCIIKTRVGLHETDAERCSMNGIIILHLHGEKEEFQKLYDEIVALDGITPKFIEF